MALEQVNYSQVVTFAPPNAPWSYAITSGGKAGSWAGAWNGLYYFALPAFRAETIRQGDAFRLFTGASLKEPTTFRVVAVGVPGFGLENVFFTPAPLASPTSSDTATLLPIPTAPRWLGSIGHVTNMVRSFTCPGGPESLSLLLRLPPEFRTDALNPGRIVQVWRGASCVWEGKLDEPAPTPDGWTVTAHGAGTYGTDYAAIWSTWNADDAVNRAINQRGLRWVNNGIGKPSGIFLGQQQDSASETITAHLNLLITGGGLIWKLYRPVASSPPASPWQLKVTPFTQDADGNPTAKPNRILVCNTPVARTIAADINYIVMRYQITADAPATSTKKATTATFGLTQVSNLASIAQHGQMEYYIDISSAGVLTAAQAQAIGQNILNRYIRASFAGPFAVLPGQVLNAAGTPVDLGCDDAGLIYRVMVTDASYGGEVAPAPLTFMSGAYEYNEDTGGATITPYQSARQDMASLISALYPIKF
jgi:hypothetical protein